MRAGGVTVCGWRQPAGANKSDGDERNLAEAMGSHLNSLVHLVTAERISPPNYK
jgi:hypothetical protein